MKKRISAFVMVLMLVFATSISALAVEPRLPFASPTLTFEGTKAKCEVTIIRSGKEIDATLSLWNGNTLIASWPGSGTSAVYIDGTCNVIKGQTYTLKVTGTADNVPFDEQSVTKTC